MILIALYIGAAAAANLIVSAYGPAVSIVTAFVLIGLDLTTRDALHRRWEGGQLWRNMLLLIGAGSVLSYLINRGTQQIALASFAAFAAAGLVDTYVFQRLSRLRRLLRINGSNVGAAAVDSAVFPALAFGFPLLIPVMVGQFAAKVGGGFLWSLVIGRRDVPIRG